MLFHPAHGMRSAVRLPATAPAPWDPGTELLADLRALVGRRFVLTTRGRMQRYTHAYRDGSGHALAVVLPGTLVELWQVLERCIAAGVVVIPQAANTGLTGGSTPMGDDYDRPVVVAGMMRLAGLRLLGDGRQVLAFPGTTLDTLEKRLAQIGREPHSVIGSSCLGASVIGGVCNNSGGSLIRRGPAYTEQALFARVDADGRLELVNHLDIDLGNDPVAALSRLEKGRYAEADVRWQTSRAASDGNYAAHVRKVDAATPARFNADTRRLFEASGSAGRLLVFAVRLDTFAAERDTRVYYVGTNNPADLTGIRRAMLASEAPLPIAAEYLHRHAFNIAERYGKDTFLLVRRIGTRRLPSLFALKARVDALAERLPLVPRNLADRMMQAGSHFFGPHLPERLRAYRDRFEHHLMIKIDDAGSPALEAALGEMTAGEWFRCTEQEGAAAFLHRFVTAGAAVRYDAVHRRSSGGVVALDIALPRNERDWVEQLPPDLDNLVAHKLYYGHFFCHVFHQDYLLHAGADQQAFKRRLLDLLDGRRAVYPAEHNVGHLYRASPALEQHYRALDPCNCLNPGIGKTTKHARWIAATSASDTTVHPSLHF